MSEIKNNMLRLGNISKDFLANNMKKQRKINEKKKKPQQKQVNRYVYNFSVGYRAFDIKDITTIHKYLMEKHDIN